jgi:carbonic anhydrase
MDERLIPVQTDKDILPAWRGTPVADLLGYQNLEQPHRPYARAELLIGTCMDGRIRLRLPGGFAFILRTGGASPRPVEFEISFAVAARGLRAMALIGHDDCGMSQLTERREAYVAGLVEVGWAQEAAERHFAEHVPTVAIPDPAAFVIAEAARLRERYPGLLVAPLFYTVGEGLLYQLRGGRR